MQFRPVCVSFHHRRKVHIPAQRQPGAQRAVHVHQLAHKLTCGRRLPCVMHLSFHVTQKISSSLHLWRHGSKGPRSFSSLRSGKEVRAELKATPDVAPDVEQNLVQDTAVATITTEFVSECLLPTPRGRFRLRAYRHEGIGRSFEPVVMVAVSCAFCRVSIHEDDAHFQDRRHVMWKALLSVIQGSLNSRRPAFELFTGSTTMSILCIR